MDWLHARCDVMGWLSRWVAVRMSFVFDIGMSIGLRKHVQRAVVADSSYNWLTSRAFKTVQLQQKPQPTYSHKSHQRDRE